MIRKIEYLGFAGCFEIGNGDVSIVVSTDFGPRIVFYGFDGGENILGWHPQAAVNTELGTWKPYGGHRLWQAPENMPLSYAPDNRPVEYETQGNFSISLRPAPDDGGVQKRLDVSLSETGSHVTIDHMVTNRGDAERELAAWALTIVRSGGEAIVPNEPFAPYGAETLLPVRTVTLWSYTDFTDPRWNFEKTSTSLRVDENEPAQQKFGVLNRQGWAAYKWKDLTFTKRFDFVENAEYPDMNSNTEIYTAGNFAEIETLSPLSLVKPGESVSHQERWELTSGSHSAVVRS